MYAIRSYYASRPTNKFVKNASPASGFNVLDIVCIPINKIPKPINTSAISECFLFLDARCIKTPTATINGAISVNLNATSCAVTVVPRITSYNVCYTKLLR